MNILILTNKPPYPPKDGSSLASLNIIDGLAKTQNKVTVLAMSTQKHQCKIDQIPAEYKSIINFILININTRISLLKGLTNLLFSKLPYNIERFIDKTYKDKLIEIISSNKFDLIQLEGLYLSPYIITIRKFTSSPIIYRSHNIEHEIWKRVAANEQNAIKSWYYSLLSSRIKRMEVEITNQIDALIAISKRDELWFLSNGFDNPSITIPSGYPCTETLQSNNEINNDVCFLGSLDWIPNQEGLIWFLNQVWPKIVSADPNIKFHIAGRNASPILAEKVTKYKNVVFHGEVENAQQYLSSYSVLAVPIISGSGMRVKIAEGMMLGKAIVTTTVGIEGIDAQNNEQVIIADSPEEFANRILFLFQNSDFKQRLMANARIFALSKFDNKELTLELVDFYKKIT